VNLSPCYTATSLLGSDKIIWSSSTQTSPKVVLQTAHLMASQETKDEKDDVDQTGKSINCGSINLLLSNNLLIKLKAERKLFY